MPIGTGVTGEIATGEADWAARAMGMISDASGRQTPAAPGRALMLGGKSTQDVGDVSERLRTTIALHAINQP
ncbi:hypothetical protein ARC63_14945 [Stenotrophomonas geniculata ATCC 19374 = JCM 13324]|nr:hypothetical protein ARC63_14945 [Stenotrophomonas geniculata ATCC 19374 = JCM 13324]